MQTIKRGSTGPEVKGLQLRLNTRLPNGPKVAVDGVFGPKTEAAVTRYQRDRGLVADGIVGPKTARSLASPPNEAPPPYLAKFVSELGTLDDFVNHVAALEQSGASTANVMDQLTNFFNTNSGMRYLLVAGDKVGVIDFRHFFAAASESYNSGRSTATLNRRLGGSPGAAMVLGVVNEIVQCFGEAAALKLNSCFSFEDLGSNRLGAGFGELVKVRESEGSTQPVSQLLRGYLVKSRPVTQDKVNSIRTPGRLDVAKEFLFALLAGIGDFIVPRAY